MNLYKRIFPLMLILIVIAACSPADEDQAPQTIMVTPPPAVSLNAGEIDDNIQWDRYIQYRNDYLASYSDQVNDVDVSQRQQIIVTDSKNLPVLGARVLVYTGQQLITESRTYADGSTLFFPSAWADAQNYRVVVQKDDTAVEFNLDPQIGSSWQIELEGIKSQQSPQLDVLFLLDATGSMGDEIAQLQNNIMNISSQINQLPVNIDVRYGLVSYRDRGDDYVTRTQDFVGNVQEFQTQLNRVRAEGGGDIPEALNEGLHEAVQGVSWRDDDTIKLVFLVADAPPHLDYRNDYHYAQEMIVASWHGIKISPIASSNTTPDGEFIFRQIAQYTMGNFIFLTYENGSSGAPGSERDDLAVGEQNDFSVEALDELVLRLITDEIAALKLPIQSDAIAPRLTAANVQAENPIPASFSLRQSPVQVAANNYQNLRQPESTSGFRTSLTLFFLVLVAFGFLMIVFAFTLGYVMSAPRRAEKRKRKNEEVIRSYYMIEQ